MNSGMLTTQGQYVPLDADEGPLGLRQHSLLWFERHKQAGLLTGSRAHLVLLQLTPVAKKPQKKSKQLRQWFYE